jgi:hypothetical protein
MEPGGGKQGTDDFKRNRKRERTMGGLERICQEGDSSQRHSAEEVHKVVHIVTTCAGVEEVSRERYTHTLPKYLASWLGWSSSKWEMGRVRRTSTMAIQS